MNIYKCLQHTLTLNTGSESPHPANRSSASNLEAELPRGAFTSGACGRSKKINKMKRAILKLLSVVLTAERAKLSQGALRNAFTFSAIFAHSLRTLRLEMLRFHPLSKRILRRVLMLLFLTIFPVVGIAQKTDSTRRLQKYLQIAAENNPKLKAKFYQYRSILAQAPQVGTLPDPKVMFMYFANPRHYTNPFSRMSISLMQHFPWFGTLEAAENRVEKLAKARLAMVTNARNKLFRNIKKVWFRMYEMHHHLKILGENLEWLQTLKSRALTLYETGRTDQVDVLRLQMAIDKVNSQIRQKKEKLESLQAKFNALLNRQPEANIQIPMPMEHHTLTLAPKQLFQKIKARNPKLTKLYFREQAAQYSLEKARLSGLPSFSIGVEAMLPNYMYMTMMPGERTAFVAKLSVSIPIYRSKYKAQKREAQLTIHSIKYRKHNLRNMLIAEAEKRLHEYQDAQYRINLYEDKLIPKIKRALELSIQSYTTDGENFEELIRLQQQLLMYEMKLNTAYVERNIADARIEFLYGKYNVERNSLSFEVLSKK